MSIEVKRVYNPAGKEDGVRVLVDRVWPRGMRKEQLQLDLWLKDAAPSTALRKWFGHDPTRWTPFRDRYFLELAERPQVVQQLLELAATGRLTLLFSARDMDHNQAVALKEYLVAKMKDREETTTSPLKKKI